MPGWIITSGHTHTSLDAFRNHIKPNRVFAFSTKAKRLYTAVDYQPGDAFLFGPETRGLPAALFAETPAEQRLRVPMLPDMRSLNLSNAVAVVVYEAWRQLGFPASS